MDILLAFDPGPGSPPPNFTFADRLAEVTAAPGVDDFSTPQVDAIEDQIITSLKEIYGAFDVNFTDNRSEVGSLFTELRYYEPGLPGSTSSPTNRDFRNASGNNDVATIDVPNFAYSVGDYTPAEDPDRQREIRDLATALAHVSAHELAHTFGLDHYDSLGDPTIDPDEIGDLPDDFITFGLYNASNETRVETPGAFSFSPQSLAKLEFAEGLNVAGPAASIDETTAPHADGANAQALGISAKAPLQLSRLRAVNVIGQISADDEFDVYSFTAKTGDILTSHAISYQLSQFQGLGSNPGSSQLDALLSLWNQPPTIGSNALNSVIFSNGIPLASPSFSSYTGISLAGNANELDAMILNYEIPTDGTYYLRVERADRDSAVSDNLVGDYELFTTLKAAADLPQVTAVALSNSNYAFDFAEVVGSGNPGLPGAQVAAVPVEDVDTVAITFSEPVVLDGTELRLLSNRLIQIDGSTEFALTYDGLDARGTTATWRLAGGQAVLERDSVLLELQDTVLDATGNRLDGEWFSPASVNYAGSGASVFPSGDGTAGGDFTFAFTAHLEGDFNGDRFVSQADLDRVLLNWGVDPALIDFADPLWTHSLPTGVVSQDELDEVLLNWGNTAGDFWTLLADLTADWELDGNDLAVFLPGYNDPNLTNATLADGDFTGDGLVDDDDLAVLGVWGNVELRFVV